MKRAYAAPLAVLTVILAFSIWNGHRITRYVERWQAQLQQAAQQADRNNWDAALRHLNQAHADWSAKQTYLHIVTQHSVVDDAESMFRRAVAFANTEEITEFQAEMADLIDQLRLIAEMERLSPGNILTSLPGAYSVPP